MKNVLTICFRKQEDSEQDEVENVVDNDDGEDLLLQKIAEEIEASTHYVENVEEDNDEEVADRSSRKFLMKT